MNLSIFTFEGPGAIVKSTFIVVAYSVTYARKALKEWCLTQDHLAFNDHTQFKLVSRKPIEPQVIYSYNGDM
jgi:hypothetical protein